jgi:hypothetical protein
MVITFEIKFRCLVWGLCVIYVICIYLLVSNTIYVSDNVRVLKRTWWRLFQKRACALNLISKFLLPITSIMNFDFEKIKFRFQAEHISTMFRVPSCDVPCDLRIKTMLCSSLPPFVYRRVHVLFTLLVFVGV